MGPEYYPWRGKVVLWYMTRQAGAFGKACQLKHFHSAIH